jgi:flagellar motor switch protein FliM
VNVSPYLLLKNSVAEAISRQAEVCLEKWANSWQVGTKSRAVCISACSHKPELFVSDKWSQKHLQNGSTAWFFVPLTLHRKLEHCLFGLETVDATSAKRQSSALASKVVTEALDELVDALINAICQLEIQAESAFFSPPKQLFKRGSGAVICDVYIGENALEILLPDAAISHWRKSQSVHSNPAVTSLHDALKNLTVKMNVEVSDAELTLGYLSTLAIGDVLKLPNKLDQTLKVITDDGVTVCHAHLGSASGVMAVEVIKSI